MTRHILIVATLLLMSAASVHAQNPSPLPAPTPAAPSAEMGWKNTMVGTLNLSQVSLHNWTQGGENTMAWTFILGGKFLYTAESYTWLSNIKATYGQTKLGTRDFEKTEDEFFGESIYSKNVGWKVNPYAALSVKTQFQPGYKVTKDATTGQDVRTQTSDFWDPGYLMQSAGFTYAPDETFATRLGVAVKETFSKTYGYAGPDKTVNVQTGIESGTSTKLTIMENVIYTSQLNLFSAFDKLDVWDVRWDNTFNAKINSYLVASLNVMVVHEIAQTRRTQVKQALAIGLTYTLL